MKFHTLVASCLLLGTPLSYAGTINGGSLLHPSDANQIETWLGSGDLDFTNIFSGAAGVATAGSFHAAADGVGPTISIYEITLADSSHARVGGYTTVNWAAPIGGEYVSDFAAFIFNLDSLELQNVQSIPQYAIFRAPSYFPTFGGGHDLFPGYGILGTCAGFSGEPYCDGYSSSHSYDQDQGQITVVGDIGSGSGNSGTQYDSWSVNSLEVYTFAPAAPVPLPPAAILFAPAVAGLAFLRRRRI